MEEKKIFLCYAGEEKKQAQKLFKDLKYYDLHVWMDDPEVCPGDNAIDRINLALGWCNIFILLWTESAPKSKWVKKEWTAAFAKHKRIIPCINCEVEIPPILANIAPIDFSDYKNGFNELKKAISIKTPDSEPKSESNNYREIESFLNLLSKNEQIVCLDILLNHYPYENENNIYFDDGLDQLVNEIKIMLNEKNDPRGRHIATTDTIYNSMIVIKAFEDKGNPEISKIITHLLIRLKKLKTYSERVPIGLILLGILKRTITEDIIYNKKNRNRMIQYLHDIGVPEIIPFNDVIGMVAAIDFDCWV